MGYQGLPEVKLDINSVGVQVIRAIQLMVCWWVQVHSGCLEGVGWGEGGRKVGANKQREGGAFFTCFRSLYLKNPTPPSTIA
jgi:hypothetical protein